MPIEKINAKIFREKLEGKIPDINYFKESSNNEKKDIIEALERVQNMYNTIASLERQEKEGATAEELSETWKNVEKSLKEINERKKKKIQENKRPELQQPAGPGF